MTANTIVIIDDERHIRDIMIRKLKGAGFDVKTACDGVEGMEVIRTSEPCLVLTDLQMPNMSGLEVCAACREDPLTHELPIIMLTGSVMRTADIKSKLEPLGNITLISKPFSPRELLRMVEEIVRTDRAKDS